MKVSDAADSIKAAFRTASLFLVRHAPKIVFGCFTTGNTLLAAKAGLHMDMDTASGALFIVQSICLGFTGRYPTASFRCAGVTGILASACLSAKGIDTNSGHVLDWWRAVSPLMGFGMTATSMLLHKEIARYAQRTTLSSHILRRTCAHVLKYPVALGAVIDSIGIIGTGYSAYLNRDPVTLLVTGLWLPGDVALFLTDPTIQGVEHGHRPIAAQAAKISVLPADLR